MPCPRGALSDPQVRFPYLLYSTVCPLGNSNCTANFLLLICLPVCHTVEKRPIGLFHPDCSPDAWYCARRTWLVNERMNVLGVLT